MTLTLISLDSLYMAISGESLDAIIKPSLRVEFETNKHQWFPRTDTPANKAYDKRTPGIFSLRIRLKYTHTQTHTHTHTHPYIHTYIRTYKTITMSRRFVQVGVGGAGACCAQL